MKEITQLFYKVQQHDHEKIYLLKDAAILHPKIAVEKIHNIFDINNAVFQAIKVVETEVKNISGLPVKYTGIDLMRKAFDIDTGLLANVMIPRAEKEAIAHFFVGATGMYKDPEGYYEIDIKLDFSLDLLLLASHLLHILEDIKDILSQQDEKIRPCAVIDLVMIRYKVSLEDLKSKNRTARLVKARHLIMFLIRELCNYSFSHIGRIFNRDHSSVLHAFDKVNRQLLEDQEYANEYNNIKNQFVGE